MEKLCSAGDAAIDLAAARAALCRCRRWRGLCLPALGADHASLRVGAASKPRGKWTCYRKSNRGSALESSLQERDDERFDIRRGWRAERATTQLLVELEHVSPDRWIAAPRGDKISNQWDAVQTVLHARIESGDTGRRRKNPPARMIRNLERAVCTPHQSGNLARLANSWQS